MKASRVSLKGESIGRKILTSYFLGSVLPLFICGYLILKYIVPKVPTTENVFLLISAAVVISILSLLPLRWVVRGISRVRTEAQMALRGELVELAYTGDDEVGVIGSSLNELAKRVRENMNALQKTNRELRDSKDFIENVLKSMMDMLVVTDSRGVIKMTNETTQKLLGYRREELLGEPAGKVFGMAEKDGMFKGNMAQILVEGEPIQNYQTYLLGAGGEKIPVLFNGSITRDKDGGFSGVVGVASDLREIKKLIADLEKANKRIEEWNRQLEHKVDERTGELRQTQQQLVQAAKLASLGYLTGGVAHELGNPMVGILNFAQLLSRKMDKDDPRARYVKIIESAARQCQTIIKGLLSFARQDKVQFAPVDCGGVVEDALLLIGRELSYQKINIKKNISHNIPKIKGSANRLQQVFLNIIANARDAMPEGGELNVTIKEVDGAVEITFRDTGSGIGKETIPKIFDPFFTTKKDVGTGLGLSVSYGIIKDHNGTVDVDSHPGKGASFIIKLPIDE